MPGCGKYGNRDVGPLSHQSGSFTLLASHPKRTIASAVSAAEGKNLGTPSCRRHPAPLQKLSPLGSGVTASRGRPGCGEGGKGRDGWAPGVARSPSCRTRRGRAGGAERQAKRLEGPWATRNRCGLTRVLQRLDVLGSGCQLRHHLHELRPGFLVLLEHCGRDRHTEEQAARCPRGSRRPPVGAPPARSLTLQHLPLTHGAGSSPPATSSAPTRPVRSRPARTPRGRPRRRLGLRRQPFLSVYPRLPGNRPEPERGRLAATAGPGRDVTAAAPGVGRRRPAPGDLRPQGLPGRATVAGPPRESGTVGPAGRPGRPPGASGPLQTEPAPARSPGGAVDSVPARGGSSSPPERPVKAPRG